MAIDWSSHPRFRLYTGPASYGLPLRQLFRLPAARPGAEAGLEAEVRHRFDTPAAVCVPMARTGLWLALRELIQPGQTVVMSPLTIIDVVNMVRLAGGIPLSPSAPPRTAAAWVRSATRASSASVFTRT
jgi:hypothetical protein